MSKLTEREKTLMRLAGAIICLTHEIDDFKKATSIVAKDNPEYWEELWEAYFTATKGMNDNKRKQQ